MAKLNAADFGVPQDTKHAVSEAFTVSTPSALARAVATMVRDELTGVRA